MKEQVAAAMADKYWMDTSSDMNRIRWSPAWFQRPPHPESSSH